MKISELAEAPLPNDEALIAYDFVDGQPSRHMPIDKPIYTHRNGETEAPIVAGEYWFRGTCTTHRHPIAYIVDFAGGLVFIGSEPHKRSAFTGQWWGPITPPWETSE